MRKTFSTVNTVDAIADSPLPMFDGALKLAAWTETNLFPPDARLGLELKISPDKIYVRVQNLDAVGQKFDNIHTDILLKEMPEWQAYRECSMVCIKDASAEQIESFLRTAFGVSSSIERENIVHSLGQKLANRLSSSVKVNFGEGVNDPEAAVTCARIAHATLGFDLALQAIHASRLQFR